MFLHLFPAIPAGEPTPRMQPAFPTTQWGLVLAANHADQGQRASALEALSQTYWPPLYAFLRRSGTSPHDAEDMVQAFILHLVAGPGLSAVAPERGRFRTFLLASLRNFQASHHRAESAQKRGGSIVKLSLDLSEAETICAPELNGGLAPDKAFDRQWARTVMHQALERLALEYRQPRQQRLFLALKPALVEGERVCGEAALAAELGMTPGALAVAATRLRQRFRFLIEDEVSRTVGPGGNLDEELQALRSAWM